MDGSQAFSQAIGLARKALYIADATDLISHMTPGWRGDGGTSLPRFTQYLQPDQEAQVLRGPERVRLLGVHDCGQCLIITAHSCKRLLKMLRVSAG